MRLFAGQFFQDVYPPHLGTGFRWAHTTADAHITDKDERYATVAKRDRLFAQWRPFWNMSSPILVEKSPRNVLMTRLASAVLRTSLIVHGAYVRRLLQYYFDQSNTYFIVVIRHPFGTMRSMFQYARRYRIFDCGSAALEHWLYVYETLFADLQSVSNAVVIPYEVFVMGNTQG